MSAAVTVIDLPNDHGSRKLGRSRFGSLPSAMRRLSERLHDVSAFKPTFKLRSMWRGRS
jgi:hypothetical protein